MDDYLAMSRGRHENALDAVRETGLPFIESFHAAIAEARGKAPWSSWTTSSANPAPGFKTS